MVSSTTVHIDGENVTIGPEIKVSTSLGVPPGDYRLVGWDMDATGKRFVDEICQIAIYTPSNEFAQYVMPFKNLSPPAKKRHHLKVVTMGRYRVLKNSLTNKVLKTKSEISALGDFLEWLKKIKGVNADGIILVHHEPRRVNPSMLIEALTKYNMLEKFKKIVKGFVNGFDIAREKCGDSLKVFSLRTLSRVLLDKEEELSSAPQRARLALEIVQHLSVSEENGNIEEQIGSEENGDEKMKKTIEFVRDYVQPVEAEEKEHAALKVVFKRQNSLKPIFEVLLSNISRRKRQQASPLRRLVAESGIDYTELHETWSDGQREGLEKLIREKVKGENKDIDEIMEVLELYFEPEEERSSIITEDDKKKVKKVKSPKTKKSVQSGTESPDTTTTHSPIDIKSENEEIIKTETSEEIPTESDRTEI